MLLEFNLHPFKAPEERNIVRKIEKATAWRNVIRKTETKKEKPQRGGMLLKFNLHPFKVPEERNIVRKTETKVYIATAWRNIIKPKITIGVLKRKK